MKVKIKNPTGGDVSVDIEMSDTPKEIITKAIEQNERADVKVIFANEAALTAIASGGSGIDTTVSNFSLETKDGFAPLEWDIPIGEQVKQQMGAISNAGQEIVFYTTVSQYVA